MRDSVSESYNSVSYDPQSGRVEVSFWASPYHGKTGVAQVLGQEDIIIQFDDNQRAVVPAWMVFPPRTGSI